MESSHSELVGLCKKLEQSYSAHVTGTSKVPSLTWEAEAVEMIRHLAEVIIYGERQSDESYVEVLVERNMLAMLVVMATSREMGARVQVQVLQTMSILVQNVRLPQSLYLMLSSNHVNALVERGEEQLSGDEEVQATFVSFLKTLSLRLDQQTVQFFLDNKAASFPLHACAVRYIGSRDVMARTAALTTLLNIYRIDDEHVRRFVAHKGSRDAFFTNFVALLAAEVDSLANVVGDDRSRSTPDGVRRASEKAAVRCGQLQDLFYYAVDVAQLNVHGVSDALVQYVVDAFVSAKLGAAIRDEGLSPPTATAAAVAAALLFQSAPGTALASASLEALAEFLCAAFKGGDAGYEPLAVASICAIEHARRAARLETLQRLGLAEGSTGRAPRATARAKSLLDSLMRTPSDDDGDAKLLFDDDVGEVQPDVQVVEATMSLRSVARRGAVACLDHHDEYCVDTLRLAATVLESLPGDADDAGLCRASLEASVSAAAAKLLAHLRDPDDNAASCDTKEEMPVVSTDDVLVELLAWRQDKDPVSFRRTSWDTNDDHSSQTNGARSPALDVGPGTMIFGTVNGDAARFAERPASSVVRAFLVVCDALDRNLADRLVRDLRDPPELTVDNTTKQITMNLSGRKILACSTLRARPQPPPAQQHATSGSLATLFCAPTPSPDSRKAVAAKAPDSAKPALEWLDVYLVFDDARLLLAVPDPLALSSGRVLSSAPLHSTMPSVDPDNGVKLDVAIHSHGPVGLAVPDSTEDRPLYRLSLLFESEKTCRLASAFLRERRAAERARRRDKLRLRLARIVDHPTEGAPSSSS